MVLEFVNLVSYVPKTPRPKTPVLMGDWCGPSSPTPTDRKQGRVTPGSQIPPGLKKGIRKILTGTPVPLDMPGNGRPGSPVNCADLRTGLDIRPRFNLPACAQAGTRALKSAGSRMDRRQALLLLF